MRAVNVDTPLLSSREQDTSFKCRDELRYAFLKNLLLFDLNQSFSTVDC